MWVNRSEPKVIEGRYSVDREGVVYSDGLPLRAVGGVWVSIYGQRRYVSYLVARAWVPNLEGRKYVVHKNGDRKDNRADNLEWSDVEEGRAKSGPRPGLRWIGQFDLDGNLVAMYRSVVEAADALGLDQHYVRAAADRKGGKTGGYKWVWL